MKKVFLLGLLVGLVMTIVGLLAMPLFNILMPGLQAEYENLAIFRAWSDPLMQLFFLYTFVSAIILAYIWDKVKSVFKSNSQYKKGLYFGIMYFLISVPGILICYSTFQISFLMTISWIIPSLIQALFAGVILAKVNK